MENTINFNIPLSFQQLVDLVRQLPRPEREKLVTVIQEETLDEDEPTKAEILENLKQDYIALKAGTLKTWPLKDVLNEL
ncbi:hypothetical protein [Dyadobacter alkalitolerans]|uniref:hypothetical protein n=1 Tax=Dyadobacter alkalitolerans TaxID=492736 RepID=UPI0004063E5B|nr:hypothetical protein [Dyadobacter alkalitolerans]